jgi:hypothetical protein
MSRLIDFASRLINPSKTMFIKGRCIVDGAVILHEVMHELKV